jgi:uncharacterized DUF497 family protein
MKIIWDKSKEQKLKNDRNIDLKEIKILIENGTYFDILENPSRINQFLITLKYKSYVHVVVIMIEDDKIIIKTCYPSRKADKKYSGDKNEKDEIKQRRTKD